MLAALPLKVPVMLVHSLWDQEDIYGAPAVYKAIEPKDTGERQGLPRHGARGITARRSATAARSARSSSTATPSLTFRREILRPFLDQYLKDGAPKADIAPVTAFETGTNTWRRLPAWPAGCASGCTVKATPLYLAAGSKLAFGAPGGDAAEPAFAEYVSDPVEARPFPCAADRSLELRQGTELARMARRPTSARPPGARTSPCSSRTS